MNVREIASPFRVFVAASIGLVVSVILIYRSWDPDFLDSIQLSSSLFIGFGFAILAMVMRDLAYVIRIRVLTEGQISWKRSWIVILLWEFASAVTPSVVGGTAFAFFLLKKEGIPLGKTTAIVFATAFLDELFFIISVPLCILILGYDNMFSFVGAESPGLSFERGVGFVFWSAYLVLLAYTVFLFIGLFMVGGNGVKTFFSKVFSLGFLKRWKAEAVNTAEEISIASRELRIKKPLFWVKAFGATILSWSSRYLVINAILFGVLSSDTLDHLLIYSRQIFMWVIMLITPTPGGSGMAEVVFGTFLSEFMPAGDSSIVNLLAFIWRLISYYPYLFIGIFLFARWIKKK